MNQDRTLDTEFWLWQPRQRATTMPFICGWAINQTQSRDARLQYDCIISYLSQLELKRMLPRDGFD